MKIPKLRGVGIIIYKQSPYFTHDPAAIFQVLFAGNYDRMLQRMSEEYVVIDADANIGRFILLAARKVGAGGIMIAIEPRPNNYRRLKTNVGINVLKDVILGRETLDRESKDSKLFREGVDTWCQYMVRD